MLENTQTTNDASPSQNFPSSSLAVDQTAKIKQDPFSLEEIAHILDGRASPRNPRLSDDLGMVWSALSTDEHQAIPSVRSWLENHHPISYEEVRKVVDEVQKPEGFTENSLVEYPTLPPLSNTPTAWTAISTPLVADLADEIDQIVFLLAPTIESLDARHRVFRYLREVVCTCLGVQLFPLGSFASNTFLPSSDVDICILTVKPEDECWFVRVNEALCLHAFTSSKKAQGPATTSEGNPRDTFKISRVHFSCDEMKVVGATINGLSVNITSNPLRGLYAEALLMQLDDFVDQSHLLKRSLLLVKAWCVHESSRYTSGAGSVVDSANGRLSEGAITVMVLWIFNMEGPAVCHPMQVLGHFLRIFSDFDWNRHAVTISGPVWPGTLAPMSGEHVRQFKPSTFFPTEIITTFMSRYAAARHASRAVFEESAGASGRGAQHVQHEQWSQGGGGATLGGGGGWMSSMSASGTGSVRAEAEPFFPLGPHQVHMVEQPIGNWGADEAFSEGPRGRILPMNIIDPISGRVVETEHVDASGLEVINQAFKTGFVEFLNLCETRKVEFESGVRTRPLGGLRENEATSLFFMNTMWATTQSRRKVSTRISFTDHARVPKTFDPLCSQVAEMEVALQQAELTLASIAHQGAVVHAVLQILTQRGGSLPLGEVGRALHLLTSSDALKKALKDQHTGLKKVIQDSNCPLLEVQGDHHFNPTIVLVRPEAPSPSSLILAFDHSSFVFPNHNLEKFDRGKQKGRQPQQQQQQQQHLPSSSSTGRLSGSSAGRLSSGRLSGDSSSNWTSVPLSHNDDMDSTCGESIIGRLGLNLDDTFDVFGDLDRSHDLGKQLFRTGTTSPGPGLGGQNQYAHSHGHGQNQQGYHNPYHHSQPLSSGVSSSYTYSRHGGHGGHAQAGPIRGSFSSAITSSSPLNPEETYGYGYQCGGPGGAANIRSRSSSTSTINSLTSRTTSTTTVNTNSSSKSGGRTVTAKSDTPQFQMGFFEGHMLL